MKAGLVRRKPGASALIPRAQSGRMVNGRGRLQCREAIVMDLVCERSLRDGCVVFGDERVVVVV